MPTFRSINVSSIGDMKEEGEKLQVAGKPNQGVQVVTTSY
jgi:hypothetical protein